MKVEVHIDSGWLNIELTVEKSIPNFIKGAKKIHLNWAHSFVEFENMLKGQYKTAWKQVIHDNFPEPVDPVMVPPKQDCSQKENFCHAVELFLKKALHKEKPWNRQYIYFGPGSNYNVQKALATKPINHLH
jgi:hypothetical protein